MAQVGSQFTCLTCKLIFTSGELQRNHYRCDWHRYNLKRKSAALPSVTAEDFIAKVAASQKFNQTTTNERAHCPDCKKSFNSVQTLKNHLNSKAHRKEVKKAFVLTESDASEDSGRRTYRNVPLRIRTPVTERIDPAKQFSSISADNEEDWEDIDDVEENESYEEIDGEQNSSSPELLPPEPELTDCIPIHVCLFCNKVSKNMEKNIEHMAISHSFFVPDAEYLINPEGLLIYLGYKIGELKVCLLCDNDEKTPFRSILAVQQHMIDLGHTSISLDSPLEYSNFYDYSSTHPDGADPDEEFDPEILYENDDWTLQLPSGAYIGHRALMRYYRQRYSHETASTNGQHLVVFEKYKALGWANAITTMQARMKARDQKVEQRLLARKELAVKLKDPMMRHQKNKLSYR